MGRFLLAVGYVLTGDRRLLREYNLSFTPYNPPRQPQPSKEWLQLVKRFNADKPLRANHGKRCKLGEDKSREE